MTNTTTDAAEARALTVTQADRDAAANVIDTYEGKERYAAMVRAGNRDGHSLCIAFARHRLATAEAASGAGEREGRDPHSKVAWLTDGASLPPATDPAMVLDGNDIWEALFGIMRGNVPDEMTEEVCSQLAAALAAAPTIPATGETWESVAAWCEQTFGPCTPYRMATRAGEELAELVEEAQSLSWSDKARIEAADVLICLSRVPGIWAAVEQKMAINRARKWNVQGDGTGYHIPATGHAATEGEGA